jgi:hypothetical protein
VVEIDRRKLAKAEKIEYGVYAPAELEEPYIKGATKSRVGNRKPP